MDVIYLFNLIRYCKILKKPKIMNPSTQNTAALLHKGTWFILNYFTCKLMYYITDIIRNPVKANVSFLTVHGIDKQ